jgi:hypothetical protein
MEEIKKQIEDILRKETYCEYDEIINKSHVADEILQLISDNYEPKKKERYNCPECGGRE